MVKEAYNDSKFNKLVIQFFLIYYLFDFFELITFSKSYQFKEISYQFKEMLSVQRNWGHIINQPGETVSYKIGSK